jgi:hypothetical protein
MSCEDGLAVSQTFLLAMLLRVVLSHTPALRM